MKPTSHSAIGVSLTLGYMARRGLDPDGNLHRIGLSSEQIGGSAVGLAPSIESEWLRRMSEALKDEALALHVGLDFTPSDAGIMGLMSVAQPTIRDALTLAATVCRKANDADTWIVEADGQARLEFRPVYPLFWTLEMAVLRIAAQVTLMRRYAAKPQPPLEVHHRGAAPAWADQLEAGYGVPVRFEQPADVLIVHSAALDCAMRQPDPVLVNVLNPIMQRWLAPAPDPTWTERVWHELSRFLPDGCTTLSSVARSMGMAPRSLKYVLRREGTTFLSILDEVRRRATLSQLQSPGMTRERLALLLGYQDARQFYRCYRRWTEASGGSLERAG
jgi:AraC-like DNA-binding protein